MAGNAPTVFSDRIFGGSGLQPRIAHSFQIFFTEEADSLNSREISGFLLSVKLHDNLLSIATMTAEHCHPEQCN